MQRGELFEFILRVARSYTKSEKVSCHLQEVIDIYLRPFYDESIILS